MRPGKRAWWSRLAVAAAMMVVIGACSDSTDPEAAAAGAGLPPSVMVAPDVEAEPYVVNVQLTDEGFVPETVFIPAGRHIRLVLRNRGSHEHHYRVAGLVPTELRWRMEPEFDDYDLDSSEIEEMAGGFVDDVDHILHHQAPSYVPFKDASWSGIKPLRNEVHGYAQAGQVDVLTFYALSTGTFNIEDVRYPEFTGTAVVFEPGAASGSGS